MPPSATKDLIMLAFWNLRKKGGATMALVERKGGLDGLNDDQLDGVAGGYIYYADGTPNTCTYEVIDDETGDVLATITDLASAAKGKAMTKAAEFGMSTETLSDDALRFLRYRYKNKK